MALKENYKKQLIAIIHKHLPGSVIYLFGSRATNKERAGSDIDLALDAGRPIPHKTILAILIDIDETTIPMKIDLVDIYTASDEIKQDILQEGIRWTH